MLEPKSADEHNVAYSDSGCPAITPEMQSTQIMAGQPSSHTWLSSHHPTTAVYIHDHKGCPAFKPLVYFHHQNCHDKINRKFNRKINREINRNLHFFIVFLIFIFQSRNQSRKFLKTTILLKKNCFQSQIEFVQKSIVRLNFFNLGAFGFSRLTHKERLNLAQLTYCDEGATRIDPVFAEKMGYYPWMIFWHQKMMFVRQFVIAVHKAGLLEISVVTFSNDNDGIIVFNADKSVDDVVAEMYTQFDDGRRAAEQQLDHSRMQSANAPNRNADWRLIKERDPPLEAFM